MDGAISGGEGSGVSYDRSRRSAEVERETGSGAGAPSPGKRTLAERLVAPAAAEERSAPARVQLQASEPGGGADAVAGGLAEAFAPGAAGTQAIAARGTASGGGPLPHLAAIQDSFGHHDVRGVRAHVGGAAAEASAALGARGYAAGSDVAFASEPDLHLAAHEAAHVIQQGGGVHLAGGLGRAGDVHERHADAVADRVVRGESAAALLDAYGGGGGSPALQLDLGDDAVSMLRDAVNRGEQAINDVLRSIPVPDLSAALGAVPAAAHALLRRYWPDHSGWMVHVQGEGTISLEATDVAIPGELDLGLENACDVSIRRQGYAVSIGFAPSTTSSATLKPSIKALKIGVGIKVKEALGVTVTIDLDRITWPTGALDALFAGDFRGALRAVVATAMSVGRNTQVEAQLRNETTERGSVEIGLDTVAKATLEAGTRAGLQVTVANPTESRDGKVELRGEVGEFGQVSLAAAGGDSGDPTGGVVALSTALVAANARSALTAQAGTENRMGMRVTQKLPKTSTPDAPSTWQIAVFGQAQLSGRALGQEGQATARGEVVLALPDVAGFVAALEDGRATDVGDLALLLPFSEINSSIALQVTLRDYLGLLPRLNEIVPLFGPIPPNRVQLGVQVSFRATREQIQAYVNRNAAGAVDVVRQLARGEIRQALRTHAETVTENLADVVGLLDKVTVDAQVGREAELSGGTPGAGDITGVRGRVSGHLSQTYHRDWSAAELGIPDLQRWLRDLIGGRDRGPGELERAPWERAAEQERALDHLRQGELGPGEGELLAQGIESQVPDLAYMREVRAGAHTIATLLMPGVGRLSTKNMNDHLVGYEINATRVVPGLQKAIADVFTDAGGYANVGQTYKSSSFTSTRQSTEVVAQLPALLPSIDQRARPVLVGAFDAGLEEHKKDPERVRAIREMRAIVDRDAFQFPLTYGASAIDGDGSATYAEALADRMHATEAALISRTVDEPPMEGVAPGERGQGYDPAVFQRFCQEAEAIRDRIKASGNRLSYGDARHIVFVAGPTGEVPNAEVIADYRRDNIREPREAETFALFRQYMHHINAFDYLKEFTGREAGAIEQRINEALPIVEALRNGASVDPATVSSLLHDHPSTGAEDPQADTASAALFYESARQRRDRIVVRGDIRGLGVTLAQDYAATMQRAAQPGADLDDLALRANDGVVEFKRRAVAQLRAIYHRLQPQVVAAARTRGDEQTARDVDLELEPLFLLGGDEITISLHASFDDLVPQFVAALQDPEGARARVGISRTQDAAGATDSRDSHIVAFGQADKTQSRVKHYEDRHRHLLQLVANIADPARREQGQQRVDGLRLGDLYGEYNERVVLKHSSDGTAEEDADLEARCNEVEAELRRLAQ
jgi:hypothetical protein